MVALAATEGAQPGLASAPGVAKEMEERMNECDVLTLLRTCHDGQTMANLMMDVWRFRCWFGASRRLRVDSS